MKTKINFVSYSIILVLLLFVFFAGSNFSKNFFTGKVTELDKGVVEIISYPSGASVSVHYTPVGLNVLSPYYKNTKSYDVPNFGTTPIIRSLPPGKYALTLKKQGYITYVKDFSVVSQRTQKFIANLEPSGKVYVISKPKGAKVNFYNSNGALVVSGVTPFGNSVNPKHIPSGIYSVVVESEGYKSYTKKVDVLEGIVTSVNANLVLND